MLSSKFSNIRVCNYMVTVRYRDNIVLYFSYAVHITVFQIVKSIYHKFCFRKIYMIFLVCTRRLTDFFIIGSFKACNGAISYKRAMENLFG